MTVEDVRKMDYILVFVEDLDTNIHLGNWAAGAAEAILVLASRVYDDQEKACNPSVPQAHSAYPRFIEEKLNQIVKAIRSQSMEYRNDVIGHLSSLVDTERTNYIRKLAGGLRRVDILPHTFFDETVDSVAKCAETDNRLHAVKLQAIQAAVPLMLTAGEYAGKVSFFTQAASKQPQSTKMAVARA